MQPQPLNVNIGCWLFQWEKIRICINVMRLKWPLPVAGDAVAALHRSEIISTFHLVARLISTHQRPANTRTMHTAIGLQCRPRKRQNDDGRSGIEWHNADVCTATSFFLFFAGCCRRPVIWQAHTLPTTYKFINLIFHIIICSSFQRVSNWIKIGNEHGCSDIDTTCAGHNRARKVNVHQVRYILAHIFFSFSLRNRFPFGGVLGSCGCVRACAWSGSSIYREWHRWNRFMACVLHWKMTYIPNRNKPMRERRICCNLHGNSIINNR